MNNGIIYLRDNLWYKTENVIKMGVTSSMVERNNTYMTGEIIGGEYIYAIEIPLNKIKILDKCLKMYFKEYNIYRGGGTEFYNRCIINLIEPYLQKLNIDYRVLSKNDIDLVNRCERLNNIKNIDKIKFIFNKLNTQSIIQKYNDKKEKLIKPNEQQMYVLQNIKTFYEFNDTGKIIWACGLGKALLSIIIVKILKFKSVLIGVPNINLQEQIKNEIIKIFPNKKNILFIGGSDKIINKIKIINFLSNISNNHPKFIITTYHSCYLLVDTEIIFDFKIGDEAHHLVGINEKNKCFCLFHKINSKKTLFMTATEKIIETKLDKNIYSMNDEIIFW